ncbi:MAG: hydrogenase maturation protease, partial [Armatimonadota bacterium]|nr:hydrogenase maturation protease [Armatimonadota bacterium]
MNTVVVGLGNILLRDEGLGVWAIRTIQRQFLVPPEVTMLDGGTLGLDLLPQVEAAGRLLVIDAVQVGCVPGTLVRLTADAISRTAGLRVSPHDVGLPDLLAAAALRDRTPKTVVLWGMEPADLSPGIGL